MPTPGWGWLVKSWNPKMVLTFALVAVAVGSAGLDQLTHGLLPTSSLLGDLAKIAIGATFTMEGVMRVAKTTRNGKGKPDANDSAN